MTPVYLVIGVTVPGLSFFRIWPFGKHLPDQTRHSCYIVLRVWSARVYMAGDTRCAYNLGTSATGITEVDGKSNHVTTCDLAEFGKLVRRTRQAAEMTVRELASRIGVSYAYVSIIELGENPTTNRPAKPSRRIVLALARELNLDVDEFLALAGHESLDSGS